jgi:hypothetical protein
MSTSVELKGFLGKLPDWKDLDSPTSMKVQTMYSNFVLNPATRDRYADRLQFWQKTLLDACYGQALQPGSRLSFDGHALEEQFRIGTLTPLCMDVVLVLVCSLIRDDPCLIRDFSVQTELLETKVIQPLDDFQSGQGWGSWALKAVASVVTWGYHQVMATHDIPQVRFDHFQESFSD